jgi:hypothetical protein
MDQAIQDGSFYIGKTLPVGVQLISGPEARLDEGG